MVAPAAGRILLGLLLEHFDAGHGPLVSGIDETLERRRGPRIAAKGTCRDAARFHGGHVVKSSGWRWVSLMWLGQMPWAGRVWALPLLTALAPAEPCYRTQRRQPRKLTDWARPSILQLRRWLPDQDLVVVGDGFTASSAAGPMMNGTTTRGTTATNADGLARNVGTGVAFECR